ncbi:MAG: hypothetical protein K6V36_09115 [Anaerolineae bacterium]|nr:hypothetical protein [Anaerolineae bacterium]
MAEELLVAAHFLDAAILKRDVPVGVAGGVQPVGDGERSPTFQSRFQRVLDSARCRSGKRSMTAAPTSRSRSTKVRAVEAAHGHLFLWLFERAG